MASNNGPFGFDADDFDRFAREAGEGLRDVVGKFMENPNARITWSALFDDAGRSPSRSATPTPPPQPDADEATTGESGSGVWAIFVVDADGGARVEQVFAGELDALRANQHNTDPQRRVRFLPYGIAVSALDR